MSEIAGGVFFPLAILPFPWHAIISLLPFRSITGVPAEILKGSLTGSEALQSFIAAACWIGVCALLIVVEWKRGLRAYKFVYFFESS